jgi:hypothetical protein
MATAVTHAKLVGAKKIVVLQQVTHQLLLECLQLMKE